MKQYIKDGIIKTYNNIVLHTTRVVKDKDGSDKEVQVQIMYPNETTLKEYGWEIYTLPELTSEEIMEQCKMDMLLTIKRFDESPEVNAFYINDIEVWLDKATRAGLMLRFNSELALKKENTTLWYEGHSFTLPLNTAMQMLYALEVYASECYDNTQLHLSNVEKLETIEEIKEYDYRVGYPEKLHF